MAQYIENFIKAIDYPKQQLVVCSKIKYVRNKYDRIQTVRKYIGPNKFLLEN